MRLCVLPPEQRDVDFIVSGVLAVHELEGSYRLCSSPVDWGRERSREFKDVQKLVHCEPVRALVARQQSPTLPDAQGSSGTGTDISQASSEAAQPALGFCSWEEGEVCPLSPKAFPTNTPFVWWSYVFVSEAARGKHVARALWNEFTALMRTRSGMTKSTQILLNIYEENVASQQFHESVGCRHFASIWAWHLPRHGVEFEPSYSDDYKFRMADWSGIDIQIIAEDHAFMYQTGLRDEEHGRFPLLLLDATRIRTNLDSITTIVAVHEGSDAVVGYVSFYWTDQCTFGVNYGKYWYPVLFVHRIFVSPKHRGKGIASLLFQRVCSALNEADTTIKPTRTVMTSVFDGKDGRQPNWLKRAGAKRHVRLYKADLF